MSAVHDNKDTIIPPVRVRRSARSGSSTATLVALKSELREEVRGEELGLILTSMEHQEELLQQHNETLEQLRAGVDRLLENGYGEKIHIGDTLRAQVGLLPTPSKVSAVAAEEDLVEDDGIYVSDAFMDFIEVHSALSKAVVDRRPLMQTLRPAYSLKGEMQVMINRGGTFGTENHMRNPILTLRIHDETPYIDGEFMDVGKVVPMSEEQVDRVVSDLLLAVRKAIPDDAA